eukprot:scaffold15049_cov90-Isochrysis_galbana.AAC.3
MFFFLLTTYYSAVCVCGHSQPCAALLGLGPAERSPRCPLWRQQASCARKPYVYSHIGPAARMVDQFMLGWVRKKPILTFLATGQHGAAELRVGPDGRLPGLAAVTKAAAQR